ncbi:fibulin-1 isoform X6 [Camelus ferus]|uniref:Fibulin-1 isoform X6 n=2 Tax=Camelus TaxID=9836 RepID=A0A8B8U282_CAMFR|nr:fibulin-1 isoform X6 [Camelus ferus]XP_045376523.1 fibulin-1 isoform X5 [Camelus bactrianus]
MTAAEAAGPASSSAETRGRRSCAPALWATSCSPTVSPAKISMNASQAAKTAGLENPASIQWALSAASETAAVGLAMSSQRTMTAKNTLGSFRCRPKLQCKSGFIQDALGNCIDINECLSISAPCPVGQTCINTEGSYTCQKNVPNCGRGYHLNEEGTRCVDVDECSPPAEPCGPGHHCVNSAGSFRCECKAGYYFDGISRTCVDINECRRYPGRLCGHKCENTPGSYYCSCTVGFRLSTDGRSCEDVNECNSSPCSQECANVYGSYQCYCRRGYQLSDVDGVTCEDIDECALPTGGHICSYRCINVPGSFQCSCPSTGYRLAPNGRNCQDVDECVTGIHNCSINETCFNIQGGFRCLAFDCPENYRRSADTLRQEKTDTVRCIKSCRPNDVTCVLDPVHTISHTVVSLPTFREFTRPEEIIFLRAITPAYPANHADIIFDITDGNLRDSFDIIKRYMDGMTVGVVPRALLTCRNTAVLLPRPCVEGSGHRFKMQKLPEVGPRQPPARVGLSGLSRVHWGTALLSTSPEGCTQGPWKPRWKPPCSCPGHPPDGLNGIRPGPWPQEGPCERKPVGRGPSCGLLTRPALGPEP